MKETRIFEENRMVAIEYRNAQDGELITRYCLATGTCTNYTIVDADGDPEVTEMSPETVQHMVSLDTVEDRLARIEAFLWPPPQDPDPEDPDAPDAPEWDDLPTGVCPPGGIVLDTDGIVYRNVSGGTLTLPPSGFPGTPEQWVHLWKPVETKSEVPIEPPVEPDPGPTRPEGYVGPWSKDAQYKVGDVVDRDGHYYRCKIAHGAEQQGGWGPPQHSIWSDLGAVQGIGSRRR